MDMAAVRTRVAVSITDVTEHPIPMLVDDQGAEANSSAATAIFKVVLAPNSSVLRRSSRTVGVVGTLVQWKPRGNKHSLG